jgi:hypothetical protein
MVSPDGVPLKINWDAMVIGSSLFIPCINTVRAKNQVTRFMDKRGWRVVIEERIEHEYLGIRVWRVA